MNQPAIPINLEGTKRQRNLLIEHLHAIQGAYGCLSAAHLAALAEEMRLAQADVILPASAFPEKTGTFTSTDRLGQMGRQAIEPPSIGGITWERLEREHALTYCLHAEGDPGHPLVFTERFPREGGYKQAGSVDALAGLMWLHAIDGADKVLYTTGRLTSEMLITGVQMGIPLLLSRSGTTRMGHAVAERVGMTPHTRCSGKRFLLPTGQHKLVFDGARAL